MSNSAIIIDQPTDLSNSLCRLLEKNGFKIEILGNLDLFFEKKSNQEPSIILLNSNLIQVQSVDFLTRIKSKWLQSPIVVLFNENEISPNQQIEFFNLGFHGVLSNINNQEYVIHFINSLLKIKLDQEELFNSQIVKYRMLFETMFSAYALHEIIVDDTGNPINYRFLEVNPAFEKITGLKVKDVVGKTLFDIFPNAQKHVVETYGAVALKNAKLQFEQFSVEHNKYFEIIAFSPKRGQFSTIFIDVTDYKEALESAKKSEAQLTELNEMKDKFFSVISHDLKNPFHNIMGFVELLYTDYNKYSEEEKYSLLEQIKNSTESAYALLVNLLEWSRLQRNKISINIEDVNIHKLAEQEIQGLHSIAESKKIKLINDLDEDILVSADGNMISTVIRNLISNAIKFSYENSEIIVSGLNMQKFYSICIEDKGVGIEEDKLKTLFKLNFEHTTLGTAKEKGTGLGLHLCKEFIEKNNGKIWAESKRGVGSRFNFILPVSAQ